MTKSQLASPRCATRMAAMQGGDFNEKEANAQGHGDRGPETRTTACAGQCRLCGRPLTGRKQRFCSDACRMAARRERQQHRGLELLNTIVGAVEELRADLGTADD
jgi:predicted nucleic acid-binding Zn ribbon protein